MMTCVWMILALAVIPGLATGFLARRFGWSARLQNLVSALGVVFCWILVIYPIGFDPGRWFSSSLGPNWANFIGILTLILPVGFAPVIAQKLARPS